MNKSFYTSLARSFYLRNNDGCGFAIYKNDSKTIFYHKGIYHLNKLIHLIKSYKPSTEDCLIVHLRKTSGSNLASINTHPFILSKDHNILNLSFGSSKNNSFLFHNGTLNSFTFRSEPYSDTFNFVKMFFNNNFIVKHIEESIKENEKFEDLMFGSNKIVVLKPNGNVFIINKQNFIEEDGFLYSNDSYKKKEKVKAYHSRHDDHYSETEDWEEMNPVNNFQRFRMNTGSSFQKRNDSLFLQTTVKYYNAEVPKNKVLWNATTQTNSLIVTRMVSFYNIRKAEINRFLRDFNNIFETFDITEEEFDNAFFQIFEIKNKYEKVSFSLNRALFCWNMIFLLRLDLHYAVVKYFMFDSYIADRLDKMYLTNDNCLMLLKQDFTKSKRLDSIT